MSSLKKLFNLTKYIVLTVSVTWLLGLLCFMAMIPKPYQEVEGKTDAVVVLTGGTKRLETGLDIFVTTGAEKILISGVGFKVTKKDIIKNFSKSEESQKINPDNIILGSIADSTISNAIEAKIFMDLNRYKSLRLVTSNYHMPRSQLIFKKYMPDYEVVIHPVGQDNISLFDGKFKLIFNEYNKLVGFVLITIWEWYSYYFDAITNFVSYWLYRLSH